MRRLWFFQGEESEASGDLALGLHPRKSNIRRAGPALGFKARFTDHAISIEQIRIESVAALAEGLSIEQRMRAVLTHGAMTVAAIADELGETVNAVGAVTRRKSDEFVKMLGADGVALWGLKH